MKRNNLLVIASTALVTALAAWTVCRTASVAVADGEAAPPPVLKCDGVELRLTLDKSAYQAGEKPVVVLTARNPTSGPAEIKAELRLAAMAPMAMVSRVMRLPEDAWKASVPLSLAPGETKTAELPTNVALKAGEMVTVSVTAGKSVLAARFSVPGVTPDKNAAGATSAKLAIPISPATGVAAGAVVYTLNDAPPPAVPNLPAAQRAPTKLSTSSDVRAAGGK